MRLDVMAGEWNYDHNSLSVFTRSFTDTMRNILIILLCCDTTGLANPLVNPLRPALSFEPEQWPGLFESPTPYQSCPQPPAVLNKVNGISE